MELQEFDEEDEIERVYTWENAPEWLREKIVEHNGGINVDDIDWWDYPYEDAANIGLEITSFDDWHAEGTMTDAVGVIANILEQHGPDCETTKLAVEYQQLFRINECTQRLLGEWQDNGEEIDLDLVEEFRKKLLKCYWRMLQEELDYLTSDEAIRETLEANEDWEFNEEGEML